MSEHANDQTFSVIIPLESTFGIAEECVRAWSRQVAYPRTRYRLILAAPEDLAAPARHALEALLDQGDRLLPLPHHHDMPLVADAALTADSDLLFFTESHCVPEPPVLRIAAAALAAHPEWSGLSLRPKRVVNNRFGAIEADINEDGLATGMAPGHWRKIMDACFVVRRAAYLASGGFDASLGHFAEWMLAARFHRLGLELGYVPEGRVRHFYHGDPSDWLGFSADFVRGETAAWARGDGDELADLLPVVPEWLCRLNWSAPAARRLLRIALDDALTRRTTSPATIARWLSRALGGMPLGRLIAETRARAAFYRLLWDRRLASRARLRVSAEDCLGALTHAVRLAAVAQWLDGAIEPPLTATGEWLPRCGSALATAGFLPPRGDQAVLWSEPAALVELPLAEGTHQVTVEWCARLVPYATAPRFYFNERALSAELDPGRARFVLQVAAGEGARLAWVCRPHRGPDGRRRGLALSRIAWLPSEGVTDRRHRV